MESLIGKSLGHYQILSQLDEGGMATIFIAFDAHLDRHVAIKVIRKENFSPNIMEMMLKRFEREAKALAQLSHPNILKVIDYGEYQNSPYLVMEYLSGGTLKQRMQKSFKIEEGVNWLITIAQALDYAHHRNMVHRDVKPSNILFTETNEPMLSDFGIAKILENQPGDALTGSGVGIGTPEYMAPEQGLGLVVDSRTDIYSLGIVLYEILTGRRPFQADTPLAVVLKHVNEPLPSPRQFNPDVSELAEQILSKALAKSPDDRYADMAAFGRALRQLAVESSTKKGSTISTLPLPLPGTSEGARGTPVPEEDTDKLILRISRLERVVDESLAAEDFDDAADLILSLDKLGERGQQAASRLRSRLNQARQQAQKRDRDISEIKIAIPQALEGEDITKAEDLLRQLQSLGTKGAALAEQFQVAVETARQQITLRQGEIDRLKTLASQAIEGEKFSQAEALLLSLSVISAQGKAQAARLQETLEKAQQQAAQRKKEIFRLSELADQQASEHELDAAQQTLAELARLGSEGKAEAEKLKKRLKAEERPPAESGTLLVTPPAEHPEEPAPAPPRKEPAAPPVQKKRALPIWLLGGAVVLVVVLVIGCVTVVGALLRGKPTSQAALPSATNPPAVLFTETPAEAARSSPTAASTQPAFTPTTKPPTNTPPAPSATLPPSATPPPARNEVTVEANNANIRSGPGTAYRIVASKPRGTVLEAVGRNQAGDWLVVSLERGETAWISTKVILFSFEVASLPVVAAPPPPVQPTAEPDEGQPGVPSNPPTPTWTPPPP